MSEHIQHTLHAERITAADMAVELSNNTNFFSHITYQFAVFDEQVNSGDL